MKKIVIAEESHLDLYRRWGELSKPYFKWQFSHFSKYVGQRIGDIGCGLGNFVPLFSEKELYFGFEPDKELSMEFERLHKLRKNVKLAVNGNITTTEAVEEIKNSHLDTIICINVLKHIKDDKIALTNMIHSVKNNGHICLIVPAFNCLYGTLDKLDGHYKRYKKNDLLKLVEEEPVKIIETYYMNFIGAIGWFIKGRIIKEKTHGNENFTITNMILPIISFVERFIKPPFGLSLIFVLKKI